MNESYFRWQVAAACAALLVALSAGTEGSSWAEIDLRPDKAAGGVSDSGTGQSVDSPTSYNACECRSRQAPALNGFEPVPRAGESALPAAFSATTQLTVTPGTDKT